MKEIKGVLREKIHWCCLIDIHYLVHVEQYFSVEIKSSEIHLRIEYGPFNDDVYIID